MSAMTNPLSMQKNPGHPERAKQQVFTLATLEKVWLECEHSSIEVKVQGLNERCLCIYLAAPLASIAIQYQ